jgi:predicted metal-binding protein
MVPQALPPDLATAQGRCAMRAILYVCTTCKGQDPAADPAAERPGATLARALMSAEAPEGVEVRGVECLSACSQGCSVALSAPGKWGYVYGRLAPGHAATILDGAAAYAASADGLVPWRDRPEIFRKQSLGRIPPFDFPTPSAPQE